MANKELPSDFGAEMATIASMILMPTCIGSVAEIAKEEDFFDTNARIFYSAILELWLSRGSEVDPNQGLDALLIRDCISRKGLWTSDMHKLLFDALNSVPSAANACYYANIVVAKKHERDLILSVDQISRSLADEGVSLEEKQQMLYSASMQIGQKTAKGIVSLRDESVDLLKRTQDNATGLPTGFKTLDDSLMGLSPGEIILVAGRPSMGKTSFAMNMLLNQASNGAHVGIFSLEMSKQQLMERLLATMSKVDLKSIKNNWLVEYQRDQISDAIKKMRDLEVQIDDTAGLNPAQLATKVKLMQAQFGLDCIYVDYIQLMTCPREKDRQQEVTTISREMMAIAKNSNLPLVVVCQLNRASESRDTHRPKLSDLRESGSLEQDAHKVLLLHREDYYRQREDPTAALDGEAVCIIAKNRQGPIEDVRFVWTPDLFLFTDYSEVSQQIVL